IVQWRVPACRLGVALGRLLAIPLLAETARAYSLSGLATIPAWAHLVVLLGVPAIVGLAAAGARGSGAPWAPPGCPGRSASAWARRPPGRPAPRRPPSPCCWARPRWYSPPGWRPHWRGGGAPSAGRPPSRSTSSSRRRWGPVVPEAARAAP